MTADLPTKTDATAEEESRVSEPQDIRSILERISKLLAEIRKMAKEMK